MNLEWNLRLKIRQYMVALSLASVLASAVYANESWGDDHCATAATDFSLEPTVTREESQLLNEAFTIAKTDSLLAIQMLQSIKHPERASAAVDFAIGNFCFQDNRLPQAQAAYEAALKKMPKFRSAIKNLGRIYLLQDQLDQSIELYQQLIADGQADADILLLTGHALLMQDYPVSAESAYRQSLLMRQKNHDAMLGLAKALMQQQRYPEGLALIGEILKEDPMNQELWELRANACLSTGDLESVIRSIETAERLGCSDPDLLATLGDLYLNQNQPADALRAYETCFAAGDVSVSRLLRAVEGFLMTDELENAKKIMARAEVLQAQFEREEQLKFLRLKGEMAMRNKQIPEAMKLYKAVLEIDPLSGQTLLLLAEIQQKEGSLEEAVIICERAARLSGFEVAALVLQAQIEVSRERYASVVTLLEAAQTFRDQPHVGRYLEQLRRMVD
ncbi:MAG: tetratricopeptide repeat protein [Verrucomicrobia bacterium]|nr:tetratricopeptide repeat protein [Verrucomicrobiota bacterium]